MRLRKPLPAERPKEVHFEIEEDEDDGDEERQSGVVGSEDEVQAEVDDESDDNFDEDDSDDSAFEGSDDQQGASNDEDMSDDDAGGSPLPRPLPRRNTQVHIRGWARSRFRRPKRFGRQHPGGAASVAIEEDGDAEIIDHGAIQPYPADYRQLLAWWTKTGRRSSRHRGTVVAMYHGPDPARVAIANEMDLDWQRYPLLPTKASGPGLAVHGTPWVAADFEETQARALAARFVEYRRRAGRGTWQVSETISPADAEVLLPSVTAPLHLSLGPHDRQKSYGLHPRSALAVGNSGLPVRADSTTNERSSAGWLLDAGGRVSGLEWAPRRGHVGQVLAVSTVPFSPESEDAPEYELQHEEDAEYSPISLWAIPSRRDETGQTRFATRPRLLQTICGDWGLVRCLKWNPASLGVDGFVGILAILCDDGSVRVLEVNDSQPTSVQRDRKRSTVQSQPGTESITKPLATMILRDEEDAKATCMTWVNTNRLAVGHTDGTVTLWSVLPNVLLQRLRVHFSHIIDICSAYPSHPSIIATIPVGGYPTLTDLSRPNDESTFIPVSTVSLQRGVLAWSDHLQIFLAGGATPTMLTQEIAAWPLRLFPESTHIIDVPSQPGALAVGTQHPYMLVGGHDGSLTVLNPALKLYSPREAGDKLQLMAHEFVPAVADDDSGEAGEAEETPHPNPEPPSTTAQRPFRGYVRILQGFSPEVNRSQKSEMLIKRSEAMTTATSVASDAAAATGQENDGDEYDAASSVKDTPQKKRKTARRPRADELAAAEAAAAAAGLDELSREEGGDDGGAQVAAGFAIHEPLTRITCLAWNPNLEHATWAAIAMGSGLVRVWDLGIEVPSNDKAEDVEMVGG